MKMRWLIITLLLLCLCTCASAGSLDGGNSQANAVAIQTDVQYIGSMGEDTEEWYTFRAAEGSAFYRVDYKNEEMNTSLYMTVYDASGIKVDKADVHMGKGSFISWKVTPNETYYLQFTRYDKQKSGRFTLSLTRTPDEHADSLEGACVISVDQTVLSTFDGTNDQDFLTFTAEQGQNYYRADFKNESVNTTAYMTLLDANGLKINTINITQGYADSISWLAEPGMTYYLQFTRYDQYKTGAYTVSLSRTPDKEGQSAETAVPMALDTPVLATFDGTEDQDFFVFTAEQGQAYYRADLKNETVNSSTYMTLLDVNGLKIAEISASKGNADSISWLAEPGMTYYLKLTRYDRYKLGTYTLSLTRNADNEGNDLASAAAPAINQQVNASFDGAGDVDVFRMTAGEGNLYYTVNMNNESVPTTIYMTLLDANGLKLQSKDAIKDYATSLSWNAEPGAVFYLQFTRYDKNKTGAYTFTINEVADNAPDTLSNDAVIADGASVQYTLGSGSDVDWFALAAPEAASYTALNFVNEGNESIRVAITDADGKELEYHNISRGNKWDVSLYLTPDAASYLCVTGKAAGSYLISRTDTADVGGHSPDSAARPVPGEAFRMTFEKKNDVDYAAFPAAGANILVTASSNSSVYVSIVDAYGQALTEEFRLNSGKSRLLTADRNGAYLALKGGDYAMLTCCTAEAHTPNGTWVTQKYPTCAEEGEKVMLCTACGQPAQVQALPASGHTPADSFTVVKAAGCDDAGVAELYCVICSTVLEKQTTPAAGHQNTYWSIVLEATCETEGLQRHLCADCGKQLDQERIPATGHFADTPAVTQPTCYAEGRTQTFCRLCGQLLEETVTPATPHTPGVQSLIYGASCESDGLEETPCSVCYAVLEQHTIPATGHAYGPWVQTVAPTTNAEGVEESTCANCGAVQSRPVEKLSFLEGIFGR